MRTTIAALLFALIAITANAQYVQIQGQNMGGDSADLANIVANGQYLTPQVNSSTPVVTQATPMNIDLTPLSSGGGYYGIGDWGYCYTKNPRTGSCSCIIGQSAIFLSRTMAGFGNTQNMYACQ